jgi:steroid delta-isomerase
MFLHLESLQFQVKDCLFSEKQRVGYLLWNMNAKSRHLGRKDLDIEGVSQVTFNSEGKVTAHFDYWDAAVGLYEKLPLISFILKNIRKRISST